MPGVAQTFELYMALFELSLFLKVGAMAAKDKPCSGQSQPGGTSRELCPAAKATGASRGAASHIQSTASK